MSDNPYQILGVARDAADGEIRKAYRKLAKKHHPDLHPGDQVAEDKFKKISSAYTVVGDPEKRVRFDRGEIDANGAERGPRGFHRHAHAGGGPFQGHGGFADMGDLFSDLFGGGRGAGRQGFSRRGQDVRYQLSVDFLEAVNGARKRMTLPGGQPLDLNIPPGIEDGQTLRMKSKGQPGPVPDTAGGTPGDALVEIHVNPHPQFERKGTDIHLEFPITLGEAVLGAKVTVPTPAGSVTMTIPKGSNTGSTLRLKGKGVPAGKGKPRGNQYVKLKVVLPDKIDPNLETFVRNWSANHPYAPRGDSE